MISRSHLLLAALSVSSILALAVGCSGGDSDDTSVVDSGTTKNDSATGDDSTDSSTALDTGSTVDATVAEDSGVGDDSAVSDDGAVSDDAALPVDSGVADSGVLDSGPAGDSGIPVAPFNITFNSNVSAMVHVGTSWYIGGAFTGVNSYVTPNWAALEVGGNPVSTCKLGTGFDATTNATLRVGSSIYVGGSFTSYDGQPALRIAKLDATTCALDTTFSPPASNGFGSGQVMAIASSGTSLYVGGNFTAYRGIAGSANRIAKLDLTTGAVDTTFSPATNGFNGSVVALAVSGTSLYVGGSFTAYRNVAGSANRIAKLDLTTGARDATFSPATNGFDEVVNALAVSGSSLYVGGGFTAYKGVADSARSLAKLDLTSGAIDTTFSPAGLGSNGFGDGAVNSLAISGTSLFAGGAFTSYRGATNVARGLAKLDLTSGVLDATFTQGPTTNGFDALTVNGLAVAGSSLFVSGGFTAYKDVLYNRIVKINISNGAADGSFRPTGHTVDGFAKQANALATDGTAVWVCGTFNAYGGLAANRLVKLNDVTYEIDTTFSPPANNGFDASIAALVSDGKALYIGGSFTAYRGVAGSANRVAKLDLTSGALDTTFSPPAANGFEAQVQTLAIAGTSLYAGGFFTGYRGVNSANYLAKLDLTSGAFDTAFSPPGASANGFDSLVFKLAASDTSLYVAGNFQNYKAASAKYVAKIDLTSGALDTTFSPPASNGFDSTANAIAVGGGAVYVGGAFTAYRGVADSARKVAKLDAVTGAIDTVFSPVGATANGVDSTVSGITVVGGSVYVLGNFTAYRGVANAANRIAKLDVTNGALDTTFSPLGLTANGFANGSPGVAVPFLGSLFIGGSPSGYRGGAIGNAVKVDAVTGVRQ